MAIRRKNEQPSNPGYPPRFVKLVTQCGNFQQARDYYGGCYDDAKGALESYLEDESCPIEVVVGEKGPKIPGVATVIFTQPTRLDHRTAAEMVAKGIEEGTINPADLVSLISTVNKDALAKVLAPSEFDLALKKSDKVVITVRTVEEFKGTVRNILTESKVFTLEEIEE